METIFLFCKQTCQSLQFFKGKPTDGISCVPLPIKFLLILALNAQTKEAHQQVPVPVDLEFAVPVSIKFSHKIIIYYI